MNFNGEITVHAPREEVFDALKDAKFFASCVEGVRDLEEIDSTHYTAIMDTKIAYIRFVFDVEVEITRMEPHDFIEAKIAGVPSGIVGRMTGKSRARLIEDGMNTTIAYEIDVALAGRLGSIGQPVLKAKARKIESGFTAKLREAFGASGDRP